MWHVVQVLLLLAILFGIGWWVIKKIQESEPKVDGNFIQNLRWGLQDLGDPGPYKKDLFDQVEEYRHDFD